MYSYLQISVHIFVKKFIFVFRPENWAEAMGRGKGAWGSWQGEAAEGMGRVGGRGRQSVRVEERLS